MDLFPWLLFVHVLGAIVAFGPGFVAPVLSGMAAREPGHGSLVARYSHRVAGRIAIPVAVVVGLTGFGMILDRGIRLEDRAHWWLGIAIVLYIAALGFSIFVQLPNAARMVQLSATPPAPGAAGSPPGLRETAGRLKRGGMLLTGLVVAITALMVLKPAF